MDTSNNSPSGFRFSHTLQTPLQRKFAEIQTALTNLTISTKQHHAEMDKLSNIIINTLQTQSQSNKLQFTTTQTNCDNTEKTCVCTICLTNQRDCVLEPCMHVCCCISCLNQLTDNKCPVCRTPIDFYLKLYIP